MKQWNLVIDVAKCENCQNCLLACKDEHTNNHWPGYSLPQPAHGQRWMSIHGKERGQYPLIDVAYLPMPCMHCDNAPCMKAAKDKAVYKRKDGIVLIDPQKAKGQKQLVDACPYNAIWWNEEEGSPQKCTFCAHLLDNGWEAPRCVQACPTGALRVEYQDELTMADMIQKEALEVLRPEQNSMPKVFYKNLYRYNQCFISGSVSFDNGGITECAKGAIIRLFQGPSVIQETISDAFGDFKFDSLQENCGQYTVEIRYNEMERKMINVELNESVSLGEIFLAAELENLKAAA